MSRINDLSLYIHIPFCSKKCSYCDFYSKTPEDLSEIKRFGKKLIEELDSALGVLQPDNIPTVYMGGGTPTLMPVDIMAGILSAVSERIPGNQVEWTCEANPESLKEEHLDIFKEFGVTRLSLGIQSFDDRILKTLGRGAGTDDIQRALNLLAEKWNGDWNGDLICEIPGQTEKSSLEDIKKLTTYNPSHISLYSLSLEKGTPLAGKYDGRMDKFEAEIDQSVWEADSKALEAYGWERYEISNFCRDKKYCIHNIVYWKMKPFLGIGPSASSTLPGIQGPFRRTNSPSVKEYLSVDFFNKDINGFNGIENEISADDFFLETLMMGFRLTEGLDAERIRTLFGNELEFLLPEWIEKNLRRENLIYKNGYWKLTDTGVLFFNRILVEAALELESRIIKEKFKVDLNWPI